MQADAVLETVLACLTHEVSPSAAHARLIEMALAREKVREVAGVLPRVLVDLLSDMTPTPPLAVAYVDTMCLQQVRCMGVSTCDVGGVIVALVQRLREGGDAPSTLCQHVLEATKDVAVWKSDAIQQAIHTTDAAVEFWDAALRLVEYPDAPSALFAYLVADAAREGWTMDDAPQVQCLAAKVQTLLTQTSSVTKSSTHHALSTLLLALSSTGSDDDLFDEHTPRIATHASLWTSRAFFGYAMALQLAWRQVELSSGRRAPAFPTPVAPEPETVLLVHELSEFRLHWHQKYLTALGILKSRLAHATEPSHDVACALVLEMLVAIAQAATVQLRMIGSERHALVWRHITGGLMPPLAAFLCGSVSVSSNDALSVIDMAACFVHMYAPFRDWASLDERVMGSSGAMPLQQLIIGAFAAWHPPSHSAPPIELETLHLCAADSVQAFHKQVHAALAHNPDARRPFLAQALREPSIQLSLASAFGALFTQWSGSVVPDLACVLSVCQMLEPHMPQALDMLHLFTGQQTFAHALVHTLSRMDQHVWCDYDELKSLGRVILHLQYLAYYTCLAGVPSSEHAYVFMTRNMSSMNTHALPESNLSLLTQWCRCLTDNQGIADDLLAISPPWVLHRITPTILSLLFEANTHGFLSEDALVSACSFFTQVPLFYNAPVAVQWLTWHASMTLAKSQYEPKLLPQVVMYVQILHRWVMVDSPSGALVRAMMASTVLPLLTNERLILVSHTSTVNIPSFISTMRSISEPRLEKSAWVSDVLMLNAECRPWTGLARYLGNITLTGLTPNMAHQLLQVALTTSAKHTWATKLLAGMFAMVHPYACVTAPLSLARVTLLRWDASHAKPEHAHNLACILTLSVMLAKNLPGSSEAVPIFLDSLPVLGRESLARLVRVDS